MEDIARMADECMKDDDEDDDDSNLEDDEDLLVGFVFIIFSLVQGFVAAIYQTYVFKFNGINTSSCPNAMQSSKTQQKSRKQKTVLLVGLLAILHIFIILHFKEYISLNGQFPSIVELLNGNKKTTFWVKYWDIVAAAELTNIRKYRFILIVRSLSIFLYPKMLMNLPLHYNNHQSNPSVHILMILVRRNRVTVF